LINYITDLSVYRIQVRRKILIDRETEQERKACIEGKENQVPVVSLLTARSATQRRGPEGAKRCVWHPRWLINRAASKLAPRQLRSYFLGNPWNIYTRRVAKTDRPSVRSNRSIRPDRFEERL